MPPVLEAQNLTKRFGGLTAVQAMSITVAEGEILGLIGPNGAGKTTMFDLLAGSVQPTSGALLCEGSPEEVARDPRVIEAYLGGAG